jgi:SdpC family antimicrobial peptide
MNRFVHTVSAVLVPIMLSTGIAACAHRTDDGAPTGSSSQQVTRDGKSVFRGLFFGRGDVAKAMPELWADGQRAVNPLKGLNRADQLTALGKAADELDKNGGAAEAKNVRAIIKAMQDNPNLDPAGASEAKEEALIATIDAKDPTFFDRFGAAMQSGDRLRIQSMLDQSIEVMRTITKKAAVDNATGGDGLQLNMADEKGLELDDVVVVVFVAVLVLVIWIVDADGTASAGPGKQSLQRDELVDLIATRLQGAR